jgi:glycerol uptake facilitator-like aquaporin
MEPLFGEFVGTALLVLLGNGVVANVVLPQTKGHAAGWIVITFGWAMAVFVAVWCVGPISEAHINPAITFGVTLAGDFPLQKAIGYITAQLLGAIAGAVLVFVFYRDHYDASDDPDAKLATFATAPAIRNPRNNFISELIGTAVLVLAVLLVVEPEHQFYNVRKESNRRANNRTRHARCSASRPAGTSNRSLSRWNHWLRNQSGARSRPSNCAPVSPHSGEARQRLGLCMDSCRGTNRRSRGRCSSREVAVATVGI